MHICNNLKHSKDARNKGGRKLIGFANCLKTKKKKGKKRKKYEKKGSNTSHGSINGGTDVCFVRSLRQSAERVNLFF
jgi:hypothetical protein